MAPDLPPVRACIFDVDGTLINSEDIYTDIYNTILREHGCKEYPWTIKALQQSRGTEGTRRLLKWANIPLSLEEWKAAEKQHIHLFANSELLPGVEQLLATLSTATTPSGRPVKLALASSAGRTLFNTKTGHLSCIQSAFQDTRFHVFGDDPEMHDARKKPCPDIFLLALKRINDSITSADAEKEPPLKPEECLVFEDSIAGVEAARRAGMRVIWVPHKGLARVCRGLEEKVLAGETEKEGVPPAFEEVNAEEEEVEDGKRKSVVSEDGWAEMRGDLEGFEWGRYGVSIQETS
ncbi:HAD-like protein [Sporormia fimetaria CBS 119925]|uniref:HAD-like protein n=1 Tax=Sporormia fimetaria CBS 119925 TaxID=1340428 RepID=A0A6A6VA22_9PLEO|nr:HAD-like protein [Sporormia fimetaria CBS 119925]